MYRSRIRCRRTCAVTALQQECAPLRNIPELCLEPFDLCTAAEIRVRDQSVSQILHVHFEEVWLLTSVGETMGGSFSSLKTTSSSCCLRLYVTGSGCESCSALLLLLLLIDGVG